MSPAFATHHIRCRAAVPQTYYTYLQPSFLIKQDLLDNPNPMSPAQSDAFVMYQQVRARSKLGTFRPAVPQLNAVVQTDAVDAPAGAARGTLRRRRAAAGGAHAAARPL